MKRLIHLVYFSGAAMMAKAERMGIRMKVVRRGKQLGPWEQAWEKMINAAAKGAKMVASTENIIYFLRIFRN
jgi:hypothetical protein